MRLFCLLAIAFAVSSGANANLYNVLDLQYQGQESAAKQRAVQQVLRRLTGQFELEPELIDLAAEPEAWIQSWAVVDEAAGVAEFKVDSAIRQALSRQDKPVWTSPRQLPWLWMMVDEGNGRQPVTASGSQETLRLLQATADDLALDLRLPNWDAVDQSQINPSEFWGLFFDGVATAAQRYSGPYTMARVSQLGGQWSLILRDSNDRRLSQQYPSVEALVRGIYEFWLPPLVAEHAVMGSGELSLVVRGLDRDGYLEFISRLRQLDAVERALPVFSDSNEIRFALTTGARPDQLSDRFPPARVIEDPQHDLVLEF